MNKKNREPTAFESSVYNATRKIPRSKVTTYKYLAEAIGCKSSRAIAQALKLRARQAGVTVISETKVERLPSPHDLRASYVGDLLSAGNDVSTVAKLVWRLPWALNGLTRARRCVPRSQLM